MGTCFSYLKRNVNMKRRHQENYCLTPRSFYQHDTDVVELQYLVSDNCGGHEEVVDFTSEAIPVSIADTMNKDMSSKDYVPTRKKKIIRRFISWLENKDENSVALLPSTEGDMMLKMIMSNSINAISSAHRHESEDNNLNIDNSNCDIEKPSNDSHKNLNKNFDNIRCNVESVSISSVTEPYQDFNSNNNNRSNSCSTYCVASGVYCNGTSRSSNHGNAKSISYCSLRVASNSDSNSSSIDLEWEPEGNAVEDTVSTMNKPNRTFSYQHQSSEDSVELSLISSAESLEWDACEGAGIVLDSDTEQLIQEIERLTARALKETGSDFNYNCDNTDNANVENNDSYINR